MPPTKHAPEPARFRANQLVHPLQRVWLANHRHAFRPAGHAVVGGLLGRHGESCFEKLYYSFATISFAPIAGSRYPLLMRVIAKRAYESSGNGTQMYSPSFRHGWRTLNALPGIHRGKSRASTVLMQYCQAIEPFSISKAIIIDWWCRFITTLGLSTFGSSEHTLNMTELMR